MIVINDLGYGSVKALLDGEAIKYPSVLAVQREQDIIAPVEFDNKSEQDVYMENFLNKMDVTVSSSSVKKQGRFLIGNAAVNSQLPLRKFDINDYSGKSDSDLSLIYTLSMIAGKKVKESYDNGDNLSKPLEVSVNMLTALPVKEGKKKEVKNNYKGRYLNANHQVTFHNFVNPITVNIKFDEVLVANEGETAAFHIAKNYKIITEGLKKDLDANFPEYASSVSGEEIISSKNFVILDIGGGTVDIVVIRGGDVVVSASLSMTEGYDNVLDEAVAVLQDNNYNFKDRTELKEFLEEKPTALSRKRHETVETIVYDQTEPFSDRIVDSVSKAISLSGAGTEEIIAVGGGSIPMNEHSELRSKLVDKLKDFSGGETVPVLFVPKDEAQYVNLKGLQDIAKEVFKD